MNKLTKNIELEVIKKLDNVYYCYKFLNKELGFLLVDSKTYVNRILFLHENHLKEMIGLAESEDIIITFEKFSSNENASILFVESYIQALFKLNKRKINQKIIETVEEYSSILNTDHFINLLFSLSKEFNEIEPKVLKDKQDLEIKIKNEEKEKEAESKRLRDKWEKAEREEEERHESIRIRKEKEAESKRLRDKWEKAEREEEKRHESNRIRKEKEAEIERKKIEAERKMKLEKLEKERKQKEEQKSYQLDEERNVKNDVKESISIGAHSFKSSITSGGDAVFPEHIYINDMELSWEKKKSVFNKERKSIPINNITQIEIETSLLSAKIILRSQGHGSIVASNFSKSDAREIKKLINKVKSKI
jgi:hypothetical protein